MKASPSKRGSRFTKQRVARLMAIQAVYEADFHHRSYQETSQIFLTFRLNLSDYPVKAEEALFLHLMTTVESHKDTLQQILESSLAEGWTLARVDPVVRSILKVGSAELIDNTLKKPTAVLISEYVELTRGFCDDKDSGYVNKVLDQVAQRLSGNSPVSSSVSLPD
jgi:N utilization substance protein B